MPRLIELLARNLGVSKNAAAELMRAGRVRSRGGQLEEDRKARIPDDERVIVTVDGEPLELWQSALVMLHKPVGVITAMRDANHATAFELLRAAPLFAELRPVGRLDLDTSGLLLWTTEGALIQRLTHPKRRVPRTYQAALTNIFKPPPAGFELADGHRPEIVELRQITAAEVHPALSVPDGGGTLASVTIIGGAYHEVRRLFAALGTHVTALCRTQFGEYALPTDLPAGEWRSLPLPPPLGANAG